MIDELNSNGGGSTTAQVSESDAVPAPVAANQNGDEAAGTPAAAAAAPIRQRAARGRSRAAGRAKPKNGSDVKPKPNKRQPTRPFPAVGIEEAAHLGEEMQRVGGGQRRIRRITLFEQLDRSPDSGLARQDIVNSNRYGITQGSYKAEFIELTDKGAIATSPDTPERERTRMRFELGITAIEPLNVLYEALKSQKLPAQQVMRDQLVVALNYSEEWAQEAVELFIVNAKHIGILRPVSGTERVLTIEHHLDEMPAGTAPLPAMGVGAGSTSIPAAAGTPRAATSVAGYDHTCFYVTPIGEDGDEVRKHSDILLGHIVEPAIEELGMHLSVVRADQIDNPGLISAQVIQHLLHARLVVADISFHNPNVFYELAIRHATGKPTVLISRSEDKLPFDISDVRTIRIDMTDIHSFVTQMETWRAELTSMARRALDDPAGSQNPLTAYAGEFQALAAR